MAVVQVWADEGIYRNGKRKTNLRDIWKEKLTGAKWTLGFKPFRRECVFLSNNRGKVQIDLLCNCLLLTRISSNCCSPKVSLRMIDTCWTLIYIKMAVDSKDWEALRNIILTMKQQITLLKEKWGKPRVAGEVFQWPHRRCFFLKE